MCGYKNDEGYADPTAYEAIKNVTAGSRKLLARKVIRTIYNVSHLAGFTVVSVTIRDNTTLEKFKG